MFDTYDERQFPKGCNNYYTYAQLILKKDGVTMKQTYTNTLGGQVWIDYENLAAGTWTIDVKADFSNTYGKDYTLKTYAPTKVAFKNADGVASTNVKTNQ